MGSGPSGAHTTRSPEIHLFGTKGYRWVLDADIEACFDSIDHVALMTGSGCGSRTSVCLRLGRVPHIGLCGVT